MIKLKEIVEKLIKCPKCGHSWNLSDGGDDPYTCHKCGNIIKEQKGQYRIYCDMDSVLTDFDAAFLAISDVKTKDGWEYKDRFGKKKFWSIVDNAGLKFWSDMPWMPDGKKLWKYINRVAPTAVLSAPSSHDDGRSRKGKLIWCKRNLGPNAKVILEDDKWKYVAPNHILIDDLEKNIIPWRKKGGIGILHKSADDTIRQLKELGL